MIIELFGLSGAGKTYSTPHIAARYGLPVADVDGRAERYSRFAAFCLHHPGLAGSLMTETLRRTRVRPLLLWHKLKMLVGSLAKLQKAEALGGGVVDAGIFQFLLVIYEDTVTPLDLMKFRSKLDLGDYRVLVFEVDDAVRAERMHSRGALPRAQFGETYQRRWYDTYMKNHAIVRDFAVSHFPSARYEN